MSASITRRTTLRGLSTLGLAAFSSSCTTQPTQPTARERVVVIGGGFGGATCARALKLLDPNLQVSLIEPRKTYTACPFSNLVLTGQRNITAQQFGYKALSAIGIDVQHQLAVNIDPVRQKVTLSDSTVLSYARLVLSPGIEMNYEALDGYDEQAANKMPHAWQAGEQTLLLANKIKAMRPGGLFVMSIPDNPYRCPPGPYERASLIAHQLKQINPRAKILLLDGKDRFSKQALFKQAWANQYGGLIEWQGQSDGAKVRSVNAEENLLRTDFDDLRADVANVIPPQRAASIARIAGATDASGWCPIVAHTFESALVPNVHIVGDAAIANAMPKSAFAANAQGRLCAGQIIRLLQGERPLNSKLLNTCYSLITPSYGISVAGVYQPAKERWQSIAGSGGSSPLDASKQTRSLEANYAHLWFESITKQIYG